MIRVSAAGEAKFRLYAELRAAGFTRADLARRMKASPAQVYRLLDIAHRSKLDEMDAAFAAIGKRLSIEILDAA